MPHHRRLFRFRVLLTLSLAYGCQASLASPQPRPLPKPLVSPTETPLRILNREEIAQLRSSGIVEANNQLGWDLLAKRYAEEPSRNHFLSPASMALALQMTLQGADGETSAQMRRVLHLEQISNQTLLEHVPLLMRKLQRPAEDITIEVAHSLWLSQKHAFVPSFAEQLNKHFHAYSESVDFLSPTTIPKINQWVKQASHGLIPQIEEPQTDPVLLKKRYASTVAYLINALYFKAAWMRAFDPKETQLRPFMIAPNQPKSVSMMRQFGWFSVLSPREDFAYHGLKLPYGRTGRQSLYLFMPEDEKRALKDLQADFSKGFPRNGNWHTENGVIRLPRIQLSTKIEYKDILSSLGMPLAFEVGLADFTKMSKAPLGEVFLSQVDQNVFLNLDESGTEAAAVTVVQYGSYPSSPPQTLDLEFNRPFVMLIYDEDTEQILFMGAINDPQQDS